jgi:AcrR family transcriptional regulator
MPVSQKTSYHHGDLKNALIQSGLEILAGEGVQGLTLRKVARRAGVSEAAPYRHFKDMEALIAAIAEQGFVQLAANLEQTEEQHAEDPRTFFYQSALTYIDFARRNPHSMRVMFRSRNPEGEIEFPKLQEAADDAFSYLIDMVEYCQQAGLARAGHPLPLALSAWSTVHGLSMLLIGNCISPDVFKGTDEETMIMATLDIVLQGWQASPTQ